MTWLAWTTAAVVLAAAAIGARCGGRRLGRALVLVLASWLGAAAAGTLAWQLGWFAPFGLLTPLLIGGCVLLVVGIVLSNVWRRAANAPGNLGRVLGGALGAACGLYVAAGTVLLVEVAASATPRRTPIAPAASEPATGTFGDAMHELLVAADRGFVRHLPLLGTVSEEMQAVREVLLAPAAAQREYVAQQRWHDLAELAACRELLDDPAFRADLDALRDGDLTALYRVQKNPRFLTFFDSERVQALLPGLRPSAMAAGVRAAAAELAAQRR